VFLFCVFVPFVGYPWPSNVVFGPVLIVFVSGFCVKFFSLVFCLAFVFVFPSLSLLFFFLRVELKKEKPTHRLPDFLPGVFSLPLHTPLGE